MKHPDQVRTRHDEWIKRALSLWLTQIGDVQLDARIAGESRRGDVLYTERPSRRAHRKRLGTLGDLARGIMLFECFRNPFTPRGLKSCVIKTAELEAGELRAARRARRKLSTVKPVTLCAITPSMSAVVAAAVGATPVKGGMRGLYQLAEMWSSVIVVVNKLPKTRATMWLRLLGRGKVQRQAVRELLAMKDHKELRDATMELLVAWQQSLPPLEEQNEADRELKMNLEQIYERWERKTLAKGRAEAMAEARAEAVLAVLEGRGLKVTVTQRKQVLACKELKKLDRWLRAAITTPSVKALLDGATRRSSRAAA